MFKGRKKSNMLCPVGEESLLLEGSFGSDKFDYFQIVVKACTGTSCASENEIADTGFNLVMLQT